VININTTYIIVGILWMLFNVFLLINGSMIHGNVDIRHALEFALLFGAAGVLIYKGYTTPNERRQGRRRTKSKFS
jgi:hypothetical protein